MTFDPTKPVQTRDGRPVTILATGVLEPIPTILALRLPGQTILASIDGGVLRYFHPCGAYSYKSEASQRDLINVPEKAEPSEQSEPLEALRQIAELSANAHGWFEQDPWGEYSKLGDIARAALAKAKGEA